MERLFTTIESMSLLEQYNVSFVRSSLHGKTYPGCVGKALANFLDDLTDKQTIYEGIQKVDLYLSGQNIIAVDDEDTIHSDSFYVIIDANSVDVFSEYDNPSIILQSVPTQDFRDILQMWLAFL